MRGGKRPGAGRPSAGQRQQTTIYLNIKDLERLKEIKKLTKTTINQQINNAINIYLKLGKL